MVRLDKAEAETCSLNMCPHRNHCCKLYVRYAERKLNKGYQRDSKGSIWTNAVAFKMHMHQLATGNGQSHSARQGRCEARMILLGIIFCVHCIFSFLWYHWQEATTF